MNFEYDLAFDWLLKKDQIAESPSEPKKEEAPPAHDDGDADGNTDGKNDDED